MPRGHRRPHQMKPTELRPAEDEDVHGSGYRFRPMWSQVLDKIAKSGREVTMDCELKRFETDRCQQQHDFRLQIE
jgi:hypothetical protein